MQASSLPSSLRLIVLGAGVFGSLYVGSSGSAVTVLDRGPRLACAGSVCAGAAPSHLRVGGFS